MISRLVVFLFAIACLAQAQSNELIVANARQAWDIGKSLVLRAAEKTPEEHYAFRPAPEVRSFGQQIWHTTRVQQFACAMVRGLPRPEAAPEKTAKADLIAALKETQASCDQAFESLTAANAGDALTVFGQQRARVVVLFQMMQHVNGHYGNLATYMRLKGIVPPSSEQRR